MNKVSHAIEKKAFEVTIDKILKEKPEVSQLPFMIAMNNQKL